jgi:hypothetical protein
MDAAKPFLHNKTGVRACAKAGQKCPIPRAGTEQGQGMKHSSTQAFFAYWDQKRGESKAPDRSYIEPEAMRDLLPDIFVLACDASTRYPFRVAGTRLCALVGHDLKNCSFPGLFDSEGKREIEDIITSVTEELLPAVAGITAASPQGLTHLELLLLPFSHRAHAPLSLTGLLAPFETGHTALRDFKLTSWRYIHPPTERLVPRALRKLKLARGLMVYEGLS